MTGIAGLKRIGLVATDPLRVLGAQTIFARLEIEVVLLSVPRALDMEGLTIVLIDSDATGDLTELLALLAAFRKKRPLLRLIVLGANMDFPHIGRVIGGGAKGYLSHTAGEAELRMAIEVVHDGSVWAPRKVMARLLDSSREASELSARETPELTEREIEVLRLLLLGKPNRQIAEILGIDRSTVKAHIGRLMRKLGVENRIALTIHAMDLNLG